jgi:lipopolysaccharide export system ATP-binding protein
VLDDILRLFRRRRRVPVRTASPAVSGRLAINLDSMGGPIYRTRGDYMPQTEPRVAPRRQAQGEGGHQSRPVRDERQTAQDLRADARQEPRHNLRQDERQESRARYETAASAIRTERQQPADLPRPAKKAPPAKTVSLAAQAAKAARHVAEHGNYLAAHAVEKTFGNRKVVKGASLYVRRGEAVGLLGPNGAGKTTIFYMITGLIKADVGRIELDGYDVTALPMYQPQEASIFRGLNVEENIRAVLEVVEPNKKKREQELTALLEEFNIERLRKTPSIALSGGERRRVEIARSLATRPNYMLLDEPFAGIDPIAVGDIRQLVRHLTSRGIGVLITDHNVRETLGLTDRAYIIYSGEVLMEGRTEDIVNNPEVRRLYLGEEFRL